MFGITQLEPLFQKQEIKAAKTGVFIPIFKISIVKWRCLSDKGENKKNGTF